LLAARPAIAATQPRVRLARHVAVRVIVDRVLDPARRVDDVAHRAERVAQVPVFGAVGVDAAEDLVDRVAVQVTRLQRAVAVEVRPDVPLLVADHRRLRRLPAVERELRRLRGARADSDPVLEILTSEVIRCAHGASVGPVDEEQLFYLMSRGLSEAEGTAMVVNGFIEPIVKTLPMDYAIAMNRLIQLQMAGAIG